MSLGAKHFETKVRMTTTDRYAANFKAEADLVRDRLGWILLGFGCEAHGVSNIHTKALECVQEDVRGFVNLGLAVRQTGAMLCFRNCLQQVVKDRIVWPPLRGEPPAAATDFRLQAITSLTDGWSRCSALQRRALLQLLPNGDWRKQGVVEVYLHDSLPEPPTKKQFVEEVASSIVRVLTWHKFQVYNQSRWLDAEPAITQPTLIQACHGLLRPTFELFCAKLAPKVVLQCSPLPLVSKWRHPIVAIPALVVRDPFVRRSVGASTNICARYWHSDAKIVIAFKGARRCPIHIRLYLQP